MDVAAAIELAFWILGFAGIAGLVFRPGRSVDHGEGASSNPAVERIEAGWTEAMFTDGRYLYGRAFSVNDSLMELDAMARAGAFPHKVPQD
jgi:hypothetical protein